jgi:hypothetical protein
VGKPGPSFQPTDPWRRDASNIRQMFRLQGGETARLFRNLPVLSVNSCISELSWL